MLARAILIFLALTPAVARGQSFVRAQFSAPYAPLTGGTVATFLNDDNGTSLVPIGFSFDYYGQSYQHVNLGTNGAVVLAAACVSVADCTGLTPRCAGVGACQYVVPQRAPNSSPSMPNTADPNAIVAAIWDDLVTTPGQVTYGTLGTAPNRTFVVQYSGVRHAPAGTTTASFQIRLGETGTIRLHYGPFNLVSAEAAQWGAAIGIEDHSGTTGDLALNCASTRSCNGNDLAALTNQVIEWSIPQGIELVPSGVAPTGGSPGGPIAVTVTVDNVGLAATQSAVDFEIRLSTDAVIDANDPLVATGSLGLLAALSSSTAVASGTLPNLPNGFYQLGLTVDPANTIVESVETNNTVILERTFLLGDDLSALIDVPPVAGPGDTISIDTTITNRGAAQAAVLIRIVYSRDQTLDAADVTVATATIAIASGTSNVPVSTTLPIMPGGEWWAFIEIDPNNVIVETDETNNVAIAPERTFVRGPDLVAAALSTPSTILFRGAPVDVDARIENAGDGAALGFVYEFYLSENALCSVPSDTFLGRFGPIDLAPALGVDVNHRLDIPASVSLVPSYLCLVVNPTGAVVEERTINNIRRTNAPAIPVADPGPDFSVAAVRAPSRTAAGESFVLERTITNDGVVAGTTDYAVYLSVDASLDPADLDIGGGTLALAVGDADFTADVLTPPSVTPSGAYFVIVVADDAGLVTEPREDNNVGVSQGLITIDPPTFDILNRTLSEATVGVAYEAELVTVGESGPVTFTVAGLPDMLSADPAGRIVGTPAVDGAYTIDVTAADGNHVARRSLRLVVVAPTVDLEVITRSVPLAFVARDYQFALTAIGGQPPYDWAVARGRLPTGLSLEAAGRIVGLPEGAEVEELDVRVVDARGATGEATIVVRVLRPDEGIRFAADVLPDARVGDPYDEQLVIDPGTGVAPFVFELVQGTLPDGLVLETDGRVHGTPDLVERSSFTVRATDDTGDFDINRFSIVVSGGGLAFVTTALPNATLGAAYDAVVEARSGTTIVYEVVDGDVPPGLTFATDGRITGTASTQGVFTFVVAASDASGNRVHRAFGVLVEAKAAPEDEGCSCTETRSSRSGAWWLMLPLLFVIRRKRAALALALVLSSAPAAAQTGGYNVTSVREPYTPRLGGTLVAFTPDSDNGDATFPLPFTFRWFDEDVTTIRVGTNGFVSVGNRATIVDLNTVVPASTDPSGIVAPWWDDLVSDRVTTHIVGAAPLRQAIVQYETVTRAQAGGGGNITMQVVLHEGPTGRVDVHYGAVSMMTNPAAYDASTGFEDRTGVLGGTFLPCPAPSCTGVDLAAAADLRVTAERDLGPDLRAIDVVGPPGVFAGAEATVVVRIASSSGAALGPFVYTISLAEPARTLFTSEATTLAPFELRTFNATVAFPIDTPQGINRFAVAVDPAGQLAEPNEANNTAVATGVVRVRPAAANLVVRSVDVEPQSAAPGDTVTLTAQIDNDGAVDATATARIVVSANDVIGADDRVLVEASRPFVAGGAPPPSVETVVLPTDLPAGIWYLGVVLDPDNAVNEVDELDNAAVGPPIVVTDGLTIATTALPSASVGNAYSHFLRAVGGDGTYAWRIASGTLPTGLVIETNGELRGTPDATGSQTVDIAVTSNGEERIATFTIDVTDDDVALRIVTRNLLPGIVGQAYPSTPQQIVVVGANGAVTFTARSSLPDGLELGSDGVVSGVPNVAGDFEIAVTASDGAQEAMSRIRVTIAEPGRLTLVADRLEDATVAAPYEAALRVVGAVSSTVALSVASPPPGLELVVDRLIGTPTEAGTFTFVVEASDGDAVDTATFTLLVLSAESMGAIEPPSLPVGVVGVAYAATVEFSGTNPTWSRTGDELPDGVSDEVVDGRLVFSGTPTIVGQTTIIVRAVDGQGRARERAYTLVVVDVAPIADGCSCRATATPHTAPVTLLWFGLLTVGVAARRFARR